MQFFTKITRSLSAVSMYRLVSISLTILFVTALVLAVFGQIAFAPLEMLVSVLTLLAGVMTASVLFGLLVKSEPHYESSYISALIIFFIISPTLTASELVLLFLAGVVASASKYLLTFRRRHIFNPAAIAVVLVGFVGLSEAWWVATPPLLVATVLLSFVILKKTRRLEMGLVFVAVAVGLLLGVLHYLGVPFAQSGPLILSWPIIFFAGFMLSEPLTLPPRKWQQLLEAAIVGVLIVLPLAIEQLRLTPAMALVIGNLFAFAFGFARRRSVQLVLHEKRPLTLRLTNLFFAPVHH